MNYNKYLEISSEVKTALEQNKAVVALESTILSHGMPYPENLEFAKKIEGIIRDKGAVPATIAILDGKFKVGLSEQDLVKMCEAKDIGKVSRRDLAYYVAMKKDGATTVATTMIIADMAGIKVFATGGLGGVHRGAEKTFDISADLQELANTSVAVVCAGAKSILDLNLTLEYLETFGVPVLGYNTDFFPAFYCKSSGLKVDYNIKTAKDFAKLLFTKWDLSLKGGAVVCNPIPDEFSLNYDEMEVIIKKALLEAEQNGIKGKDTTPFLLAKIKEITKGVSLESNLELAYNNARLASDIAVELSNIK